MKLIVTDYGDRTVGIPQTAWEVECPFEKENVCNDGLEYFRTEILKVFNEYTENGNAYAEYDFELQEAFDE